MVTRSLSITERQLGLGDAKATYFSPKYSWQGQCFVSLRGLQYPTGRIGRNNFNIPRGLAIGRLNFKRYRNHEIGASNPHVKKNSETPDVAASALTVATTFSP
jgi:hypothetical protein